jgi:hypothetical protein
MKEVRDVNNDIFLSVTNQIEAQNQLADAFGTTGLFSEQMIKDQIALTKKIGLTNEEASAFSLLAKSNNQTQLEATILVGKQVQDLVKQKGIMLDTRKVMADVAKVQGQLRLQYGNSTEQLAKAVVLSKSLGMTFEQANLSAKKLLDFESSISNELEAELLTGKDLNLEEARKLALMGKTAEAQALIMEQVGSAAEFANMNVFAQESLAAAAGMTADELANSLVQQENLNNLGTEQRANLEEEKSIELQRLQAKIDGAALGTQARVDAELEYAGKKQEIDNALIVNNKATEAQITADKKAEEEARRNINNIAIQSAQGLVGILAGLGEDNKELQKAALIANGALSIAEIINNTNVGSSKEIATKGIFGLSTSTVLYAKMAISIGSVIAATAKGLSALGKSGAPTGGGAGGGGATPAAPQFNVVGQGGANQIAQGMANQEQAPVQAYVVAGAVTSGQALNRNIINNASMG